MAKIIIEKRRKVFQRAKRNIFFKKHVVEKRKEISVFGATRKSEQLEG